MATIRAIRTYETELAGGTPVRIVSCQCDGTRQMHEGASGTVLRGRYSTEFAGLPQSSFGGSNYAVRLDNGKTCYDAMVLVKEELSTAAKFSHKK